MATALNFIHLTKSQRNSLKGQLFWVSLRTGSYSAHWSAKTFLERIGAVERGSLTQAGISLMADYGNEIVDKLTVW